MRLRTMGIVILVCSFMLTACQANVGIESDSKAFQVTPENTSPVIPVEDKPVEVSVEEGVSLEPSDYVPLSTEVYEPVPVRVETFNRARSMDYEAIEIDHIHYIHLEDFIEVCKKINSQVSLIRPINIDSFDFEDMTLQVTYKAEANYSERTMWGFNSEYNIQLADIDVKGEDYTLSIDLWPYIKKVDDSSQVYLPIYLINYKVFNSETFLYRLSETDYKMGYGETLYLSNESPSMYYQDFEDYQMAYDQSIDFLENQYETAFPIPPHGVHSFEDYLFWINRQMMTLEDSHYMLLTYGMTYDTEATSALFDAYPVPESSEAFYTWSYEDLEGASQTNKAQWLDEATYYMPLHSFDTDLEPLRQSWDTFMAGHTGGSTLILDLRHNLGGDISTAYTLLAWMAYEDIYIQVDNLVNQVTYGGYDYHFQKSSEIPEPYTCVILCDEYTCSASIFMMGILKDNVDAKVMGIEPPYKDANHRSTIQLLDGSLLLRSACNYLFLNQDGQAFNEIDLVDIPMTDQEMATYLESFGK